MRTSKGEPDFLAIWLFCVSSTFSLNVYPETYGDVLSKLTILPEKKFYPKSLVFLWLEKIKSIFLSSDFLISFYRKHTHQDSYKRTPQTYSDKSSRTFLSHLLSQ